MSDLGSVTHFSPAFAESGAPGMVLVVVRGDATLVRGYGETEKGNKHEPDGNSLLRLNSITKVFTTEVLVSLAADRKLALTDKLQRFTDKVVPSFGTAIPRQSHIRPFHWSGSSQPAAPTLVISTDETMPVSTARWTMAPRSTGSLRRRMLPLAMREMSSRSSTSRARCLTWRSTISRAG